jgi:hypothetical protein
MEIHDNDIVFRQKPYTNLNSKWHPDDSKEMYEGNQNNISDYYKNSRPVTYTYNYQGYRCNEIDSYKGSKFIIAFGCSYTEGIGLHKEDIWHSLIGEELNMPVMNLGVGGTGPDFQCFNTLQYLKNNFPKPKYVIYQWPSILRKYFLYAERAISPFVPQNPEHFNIEDKRAAKQDKEWFNKRFLVYRQTASWDFYQYVTTCNLLWQTKGITPIHWAWKDDMSEADTATNIQNLIIPVVTGRYNMDEARDCSHPGPIVHREVVRQLKEHKYVQKIYNMA